MISYEKQGQSELCVQLGRRPRPSKGRELRKHGGVVEATGWLARKSQFLPLHHPRVSSGLQLCLGDLLMQGARAPLSTLDKQVWCTVRLLNSDYSLLLIKQSTKIKHRYWREQNVSGPQWGPMSWPRSPPVICVSCLSGCRSFCNYMVLPMF